MQHAACGMRHAKYRSSAVERCVVTCGTEGQCKVPLLRWRFQPSRGGQGAGPSYEKTSQAEDERYPTRRGRWPAWGRGCAGEGRLLARGGPALRALPVEGRGHKTPRHVGKENERICRIGLGTSTLALTGCWVWRLDPAPRSPVSRSATGVAYNMMLRWDLSTCFALFT